MTEPKFTPGPWLVGYRALDVVANSLKGGFCKVCDIRGWGYLTGKGDGALGLPPHEAEAIQRANAALIAAAPDYHRQTDLNIGGLELLRMSIRAGDAPRELLARVEDLIRENKAVQAKACPEAP